MEFFGGPLNHPAKGQKQNSRALRKNCMTQGPFLQEAFLATLRPCRLMESQSVWDTITLPSPRPMCP